MGHRLRLQGGAQTRLSLFVDTSVWSLALRRDAPPASATVLALMHALEAGETIVTTGLVLQELLQGFSGPKDRRAILDRFSALPLVVPDRQDHVEAAELRNPRLPKVLFTPLPHGGWKVQPLHTLPANVRRCRGLRARYVITRGHPGGVLVHH